MKARRREWAWLAAGWLLAVVVFRGWPGLDLWVSAQFHAGAGVFPLDEHPVVRGVYLVVPWLGRAMFVASLLVLLWAWRRPAAVPRPWARRAGAMALVLVLGLTGVVHGVFKDHWGRPRPVHVTEFNGPHPFQPALQRSDLCQRNCSFVSGHAGTGYVLMALGLFGAPATRRRWWAVGLASGLLIGLGRVMQGGHFASDVVFGALIIGVCAALIREAWLRLTLARRRRRLARPA